MVIQFFCPGPRIFSTTSPSLRAIDTTSNIEQSARLNALLSAFLGMLRISRCEYGWELAVVYFLRRDFF
jgi:hypothetical protein